jgi:hypothetical protein
MCLCGAAAHASSEDVFAWLETPADARYLQIVRDQHVVAYSPEVGLLSCDQVSISETAARSTTEIAIAAVDGSRLSVKRGRAPVTIGCASTPGVSQQLAVFLRNLFTRSNERVMQLAATRQPCRAPDIPLLSQSRKLPTLLSAGRTSLLLTWVGVAPLDVNLWSGGGGRLAHEGAVDEHVLRLSAPIQAPGNYALQIKNRCHADSGKVSAGRMSIRVVPAGQRPPLPQELQELPEPQRTIFYADFLLSQADGIWGLEGLQLVGALPESAVVKEWIGQWADE